MRARTSCLAILSILVLAGCSPKKPTSSGRLQVVRDTVGDTMVVRTVSGSVWGAPATLVQDLSIGKTEGDPHYLFGQVAALAVASDGTIYVLDFQADNVKAFAPGGTWVRTLGRRGGGPGEFKQPDGMTVLPDGRVLVSDLGNQRIQVYDPDGTALKEWPFRSNLYASDPLWSDRAGNAYAEVLTNDVRDPSDWREGLVRYGPDGAIRDTLPVPRSAFEVPQVEGHSADGGANVSYNVPFSPSEAWAFAADGYFVHAVSTDYRIDLLRTNVPVLRIEKAYEPVAVQSGEKEAMRERVVRGIRRTIPDWKWNGPGIPDHKPPLRTIFTGAEGRLWVLLYQRGVREPNPDYDPKKPGSEATRWTEPVVFDVFENDGTYDGEVRAPSDLSQYPRPFFRGDTVWAVTRDSLGVERVARFHVQHGGG